jgi:hypothetical protein
VLADLNKMKSFGNTFSLISKGIINLTILGIIVTIILFVVGIAHGTINKIWPNLIIIFQ